MTYIHFTEEQKYRASCMGLVELLRRQGEKPVRLEPEYHTTSDHDVTTRGNEWYDHASEEGGGPISLMQNYCGLSYLKTVTRPLDGEQGRIYEPVPKEEEPKKESIQPPVGREMRQLYAYLLEKRLIDREVPSTSVRAELVYKDERYYNAVFIGKDGYGVVRYAHKRSTGDMGEIFRINVESSDPRYSFHWNGTSGRFYIFGAPTDLFSFLTLYPRDWQQRSYVALYDVGKQAILRVLEQVLEIRHPILCLDHDAAGIEATGRLRGILAEWGYAETAVLQLTHEDWNRDVKTRCGLEAQNAEEYPQLMVVPEVRKRVCAMSTVVKLGRLNIEVPWLIEQYRIHLHWGRFDQTTGCIEQASMSVVAACRHELRQPEMTTTEGELAGSLYERIHPHWNRENLKNRHRELASQFQSVLALEDAAGFRTQEKKKTLTGRWLEPVAAFVGVPTQYETGQMEQWEV